MENLLKNISCKTQLVQGIKEKEEKEKEVFFFLGGGGLTFDPNMSTRHVLILDKLYI